MGIGVGVFTVKWLKIGTETVTPWHTQKDHIIIKEIEKGVYFSVCRNISFFLYVNFTLFALPIKTFGFRVDNIDLLFTRFILCRKFKLNYEKINYTGKPQSPDFILL